MLLYHVGDLKDRTDFFRKLPARRKVDAVVVVAFPVDQQEQTRLALMGVHVVAAGGQSADYPFVSIDDYQAGQQAVGHLLHLGHRRVAMLEAMDPDQPNLVSHRSDAYYDALSEAGIAPDPELVVRSDWGGENGALAMGQLLGLRRPPTAVFAHSDEVALGALRTIRRAGLSVPGHISVVGIDDHPSAALADLTTVRQDPFEQGRRTAELLLTVMRGDPLPPQQTMATTLVVRATTGPPPEARSSGRRTPSTRRA